MTSLVDYLRDKLDHADNPPPAVEHPGFIGYGFGLQAAVWSDGRWRCLRCEESGQAVPKTDVLTVAWDHLGTHRPKPKKWWWRR